MTMFSTLGNIQSRLTFLILSTLFVILRRTLCELNTPHKKSMFGDLGDEIHTKFSKKKSSILIQNTKIHHNRNTVPVNQYINPLFYRDFTITKGHVWTHNAIAKKSNINTNAEKKETFSVSEIVALHKLKQIIERSSAHIVDATKKRHRILSRTQAVQLAKSLRGVDRRRARSNMRIANINSYNIKPFINPTIDLSAPKNVHSDSKLNVNPSKPFSTMTKIPGRVEAAINRLLNKQVNQTYPIYGLYKREKLVADNHSRDTKKESSFNFSPIKNDKNDYYIHKSLQYKNNSLVHDLSKVTMQWTGYKALDAVKQGKSPPTWIYFLKGAMQPQAPIKGMKLFPPHLHILQKSKQINTDKPSGLKKSKDTQKQKGLLVVANHDLAGTLPDKRKIDKSNKEEEKNKEEEEEEMEPEQKVLNVTIDLPTPVSQTYQTYKYPVTYQYPVQLHREQHHQQQQQQYYTAPGVIPWNYYHSEKLADGRIRPALYPIAKHIPTGKCLPESSLCDKGHDEQCCGSTTFCIDYWGISKCLAFHRQSFDDFHNLYQIRNNVNYKNYYRYLTSSIFDDIRDKID